jgi:L-rhamnose isomerase
MQYEDKKFTEDSIEKAYELAKESYAVFDINTDTVINAALQIPVSIHCWQGDDVTGFEGRAGLSDGGIVATGNYPGRARNAKELRADIEFAFSLIPGSKRLNLHSIYFEANEKVIPRDELLPEHFQNWIKWSLEKNVPLDFNPSLFSHPMASSGATLSSRDKKTQAFWIRHCIAARKIAAAFGANQGAPSVCNLWIPDGSKDLPADRLAPRQRLRDALDEIFSVNLNNEHIRDAVECKLFGIGSESYVVGSHEFYLAYAVAKQIRICLDAGHFHPTEYIADKITAALLFLPGLLIHFSRGVRWDSDHVILFSDEVRDICREIARQKCFNRVDLALDFFDASINRIAAWTIGSRNLRKGILEAMLEPHNLLLAAEEAGKNHERLALMEEFKTLPFVAVWDKLCLEAKAPVSASWLENVRDYEKITSKRVTA